VKKKKYVFLSDVPAYGKLVVDAVSGLNSLVEAMHRQIAGIPSTQPSSGIPGLVYSSIRRVINLIRGGSHALAGLFPVPEAQWQAPEPKVLLAALTGYPEITWQPLKIR
jgi:hypothetical protein